MNKQALLHVTTCAVLCACAMTNVANADPMATDRPDFVESSTTVGAGRWQIEMGLVRERGAEGESTSWLLPTLLRVGLGDSWELRFESDTFQRVRLPDGETFDGLNDLAVGLKYHVQAEPLGASLAWLVHADLDTGSAEFRGTGVRPSLRLVAEWALNDDWSLGVMPGVVRDHDGEGRYTAWIASAVIGRALSDHHRVFAEIQLPQIAATEHGGTQAAFDVGGAWLLSDDLQLDTAISLGLNERTPDWAWTLGLSIRW